MWQVNEATPQYCISCRFHLQRRSRLFSGSQESSSSCHMSICFDWTPTTTHAQVISAPWQPRQRRVNTGNNTSPQILLFSSPVLFWTKLQAKHLA